MKNYLKLLIFTLILSLSSQYLTAQGNKYKDKDYQDGKNYRDNNNRTTTIAGWERIGSNTVQKVTEVDDFRPSSRRSYSALKIRVKESPVTINKMTIYYEGGQIQDLELRRSISPGQETRTINLIGNRRRIEKIRFLYKTRSILGSRAVVEVWAKRY